MAVFDASAIVHLLLRTTLGEQVDARLRAVGSGDVPHLIDLEVASTLRRLEAAGRIRDRRAVEAIADLVRLPLRRYPASILLPRVWELRRTLTAYDAAYVALAEALSEPLLTSDGRLARAHGHDAQVELFEA